MLGPLIAAGASLAGGLIGQQNQNNAIKSQEAQAERNIALQKEFAQSGIQWKVQDAQKAGIHPLYALGANTTAFSPVSIGTPSGNPMGEGLARMGQDLSRAVTATSTTGQRANALMTGLATENAGLQNELLRAQIAKLKAQVGPPIPTADNNPWAIPGQAATLWSDSVKPKPHEITATRGDVMHQEPGPMPALGFANTGTGYMPIPSKDIKDRIEDMGILPWIWGAVNNIAPNFGLFHSPPGHIKLKEDEYWYYHPKQEYRIGKKGQIPW